MNANWTNTSRTAKALNGETVKDMVTLPLCAGMLPDALSLRSLMKRKITPAVCQSERTDLPALTRQFSVSTVAPRQSNRSEMPKTYQALHLQNSC